MRHVSRLLPIVLLAALVTGALAGRGWVPSVADLAAQQAWTSQVVAERPVLAAAAYVGVYIAVVAASVPGGTVLSIAGGALFGALFGTVLAVLGATSGAALLFLLTRGLLAGWAARQAGPLLDRIRPGLERDGFNALLAARLLPVVPFWLVNLAAPLAGMRLGPFVLATAIGITPATAVFVSIGAGLGGALAAGVEPGLGTVLQPAVLLPLLAMALLALVPVAWRRLRASRG